MNIYSWKVLRALPHPQSLSPREREVKSFSLGEKGWDEGGSVLREFSYEFRKS